jgi:hypothetical protein
MSQQKESEYELDDLDEENARRRSIFEDGQEAYRQDYGYGANPHFSPLEHQIWHNGWMWEAGTSPRVTLGKLFRRLLGWKDD